MDLEPVSMNQPLLVGNLYLLFCKSLFHSLKCCNLPPKLACIINFFKHTNFPYFIIAIVAACSAAGLVGLVVAGVCWYKLQRNVKAASETDYPAYGVTGPAKRKDSNSGDRKLAQSAQMYHYQHQKQQMLAMEK